MYNTHTAHSGDGHRAGDETETLVHTDVQICGPGKRETSFWGPFFSIFEIFERFIWPNDRTYMPSSWSTGAGHRR